MAKPLTKSQKAIQNRTNLEWALLVSLLIIVFLLFASVYTWWPWSNSNSNLGTAFYKPAKNLSLASETASTGGGTGSGTTGSGGSGSNGGGSGGGGSTSSKSRLITFAAGVNTGDSKQETQVEAGDLDENCAVLANITSLGKQEVCTYREGDKLVTVTYLNDNVISASRSGF